MSKKKGGGDVTGIILEYFNKQNRPYNALQTFENLQQQVSKPQATKALVQLSSNGSLIEKVNGKQKLYYPDQTKFGIPTKKELEDIDNNIKKLEAESQQVTQELQILTSESNNLKKSLTNEELDTQLAKEEEAFKANSEKLATIKASFGEITAEDKEKIEKKYEDYRSEWRKRKRIVRDIIDQISESSGKVPKKLFTEIGIETDEAVGSLIDQDRVTKRRKLNPK